MCKCCENDIFDKKEKMLDKAGLGDWEEVRHRKAGGKKKTKKSDHKHLIAQEREAWYQSPWSVRQYKVLYFNCVICEDKPSHKYVWNWDK